MIQRYKCTIAYDGTTFYGWQEQPTLPSVSKTMREVITTVTGQKTRIVGASRTDSGVHARGQIALVEVETVIPTDKLHQLINSRLPKSICLQIIETAPPSFHPFHGVHYKTYIYYFSLKRPDPFTISYSYYYHYRLSMERLAQVLACMVGTHDFRAFSTGEPIGTNPVCTVYSATLATISEEEHSYAITIRGNRFLRHMVRRLVGAALAIATLPGRFREEDFLTTLHHKNPNHTLPCAPAHGLVLHSITYHPFT